MATNEYAVEPTAFRDHRDIRYLFEKFGFHTGRLLVAFPGRWVRLVYDHLDGLPELERKRAVELLRKYKDDRVIPCGEPYVSSVTWVVNAAAIRSRGVVDDAIAASPNEQGLPTLEETDERFFGAPMALVAMRATNYASVARRLIQHSHQMVLVDPYFDVARSSNQSVLGAFLDVARGGKCTNVRILCRYDEPSSPRYDQQRHDKEVSRILRGMVHAGQFVTIEQVDDGGSRFEMHARYLISDKGALHYDNGFKEETEPRFAHVSPVDRDLHGQLCRLYLEGEHDFVVKHRIAVGMEEVGPA